MNRDPQAAPILHRVQEASSKRTEVSLVAAGIGAALIPKSYSQIFHRDGVVYRPIRGELPAIEIVAIWSGDNTLAQLRDFLQVVRAFGAGADGFGADGYGAPGSAKTSSR